MSAMCSLLFVGGWLSPVEGFVEIPPMLWFCIKILLFVCIFIWIRAAFPRFRFDQLMVLMWRACLPITFLLLTGAVGLHLGMFICYWFRYICFIVVLCILSLSFYVHDLNHY
jgi:NADH-quinone oxidoreductase subunit H